MEVATLPVQSVGELNHQIAAGELDGKVAAVRGYLIQSMVPSCPAPNRWYSPLEGYCFVQVLSDTAYPGSTCTKIDSGTSCQGNGPPPSAEIVHALMPDNSSYLPPPYPDMNAFPNGLPMVVIGHAGDPRYLQCREDVRDLCRRAFVVDSIAWSVGKSMSHRGRTSPTPRCAAVRLTWLHQSEGRQLR